MIWNTGDADLQPYVKPDEWVWKFDDDGDCIECEECGADLDTFIEDDTPTGAVFYVNCAVCEKAHKLIVSRPIVVKVHTKE